MDFYSFSAVVIFTNNPYILDSNKRKYHKSYVKGSSSVLRNIENALRSDLSGKNAGDWAIVIFGEKVLSASDNEIVERIISFGGKVFFRDADRYYG
jgi:hypothetical protein